MTDEEQWAQSWAADVRLILKSSGVSQAAVDREMGVTPGMLNQYLQGTRSVSVAMAERINAAVSAVVKHPDVSQYLSFVTAPLTRREDQIPAAVEGAVRALHLIKQYVGVPDDLDDAYNRGLVAQLRNEATDFDSIVFELSLAWRRSVVRSLEANTSVLLIDELSEILSRYGITLIDDDNIKARVMRLTDAVEMAVTRALATATNNAQLRYSLEREIFDALHVLGEAYMSIIARLMAETVQAVK